MNVEHMEQLKEARADVDAALKELDRAITMDKPTYALSQVRDRLEGAVEHVREVLFSMRRG